MFVFWITSILRVTSRTLLLFYLVVDIISIPVDPASGKLTRCSEIFPGLIILENPIHHFKKPILEGTTQKLLLSWFILYKKSNPVHPDSVKWTRSPYWSNTSCQSPRACHQPRRQRFLKYQIYWRVDHLNQLWSRQNIAQFLSCGIGWRCKELLYLYVDHTTGNNLFILKSASDSGYWQLETKTGGSSHQQSRSDSFLVFECYLPWRMCGNSRYVRVRTERGGLLSRPQRNC